MRLIVIVLGLLLTFCTLITSDTGAQTPVVDFDQYYATYPYMSYRGTALTFDTEFDWPEGYQRVDSASLSPFQYWVSYMPLWSRSRAVGSYSRGLLYRPEEITRPFNLPWRTLRFNQRAVAFQILAEYTLVTADWWEFKVLPDKGDTLTFKRWLEGKVVFNARDSLYFLGDEPREPSETEFNRFFSLVSENTDFWSLRRHTDSVAEDNILPGDMLYAHDERGRKGVLYIVMCVIENDADEKLYIVGNGCERACDFHIRLFNDQKDYPWITLDKMKELIPSEFTHRGFMRFKGM